MIILSKIKNFFTSNRKEIAFFLSFLVVFSLFGDFASAKDVTQVEIKSDLKGDIAAGIEYVMRFIAVLLGLMTYITSMFLSPEWINGSLFGLTVKFKDIWILVSNVVYFIFALILIWIAFMNIIGSSNEKYQLKQALPRFVIGILIVPFSWFLVQFVLSISAVLTMAAINLPFDTFPDLNEKSKTVEVSTDCYINMKGDSSSTNENDGFYYCKGEKVKLSEVLQGGESSQTIFGIVSVYTYGLINLEGIDQLDKGKLVDKFSTVFDLVVKVVFDVLFIVVYAILMIALALVFMVRGFYIWIYVMLSPIFGLMYFFEKNDGGGEGMFKNINIKEFISLAFVPVYAMLALSFGILFISIVGDGLLTGDSSGSPISISQTAEKDAKFALNGNGDEKTSFSLTIKGMNTNIGDSAGGFIGGKEVVDGTLGFIGALILKIFGIVVLWGGMMAAMRHSDITSTVVEPLHAFGGQVGTLMSKSPQYLPIFGGQSMQSMKQIPGYADRYMQDTATAKSKEFATKTMPFLDKDGSLTRTASMKNISAALKSNNLNNDGKREKFRELLAMYKGKEELMHNNEDFKKILGQFGESLKVKIDTKSITSQSTLGVELGKIEKVFDGYHMGITKEQNGNTNNASYVKDLVNSASKGGTTNNVNQNINNYVDSKTGKVTDIDEVVKLFKGKEFASEIKAKEYLEKDGGITDSNSIDEIFKNVKFTKGTGGKKGVIEDI